MPLRSAPKAAGAPHTFAHLDLKRSGPVLHVSLNRPETGNALSLGLMRELLAVLRHAQQAPELRVLLLRGQGGSFCSGLDEDDRHAGVARAARAEGGDRPPVPAADPWAEVSAWLGECLMAWSQAGLATVSVLEGEVRDFGVGLAALTDLTLASSRCTLQFSDLAEGHLPAQALPHLVERIGAGQARRLLLTGARLTAEEARAIGLVDEVVAPQLLTALADERALALARTEPAALASAKMLWAQARGGPSTGYIQAAAAAESRWAMRMQQRG